MSIRKRLAYTIEKEIDFEASHILNGLTPGHKCGRMHGHNYKVFVTLKSYKLDDCGFVMDFGVISTLVKEWFDHRHINDVLEKNGIKSNPTAEVIAQTILEQINRLLFSTDDIDDVEVLRVRVYETATCWAEITVEEEVL